nr:MAG TPA: Trm112p-like protein [Caudoviricetes sp.]
MRTIDADKLVDMLYDNEFAVLCPLDEVSGVVDACPTVDAVPVVHGCFEPCFDENGNWRQGFAKCSNCGKEYYAQVINHFGYCPNCGAKMDGGDSE